MSNPQPGHEAAHAACDKYFAACLTDALRMRVQLYAEQVSGPSDGLPEVSARHLRPRSLQLNILCTTRRPLFAVQVQLMNLVAKSGTSQ